MARRAVSTFLLALAIAALAAGFITAKLQGMDKALPRDSYTRAIMSIGISISRLAHHAHGYVLYSNVIKTLSDGLANGLVIKPGQINATIDTAAVIDLGPPPPAVERDWGDDKGYSDFTTLAFILFGQHIEAMFYFYFVLLTLASTVYVLQFHDDVEAMILLVVFLVAHVITLSVLPNSTVTSVLHDARFLPVISCISVLHWILGATKPPKHPALALVLLFAQAVIVVFVIDSRSSAIWQLIACCSVMVISSRLTSRKWFAPAAIGIMLCVYAGLGLYKSVAYDARYKKDGTSSHVVWHNIYMGLGFHPEAVKRFDLFPDDSTVYRHAAAYLEANPPERTKFNLKDADVAVPVFPTVGWRAYDQIVRDMFFDFIHANPRYTLASFLIYKPLYLAHELAWQFGLARDFPKWIAVHPAHQASGNRRIGLSVLAPLSMLLALTIKSAAPTIADFS